MSRDMKYFLIQESTLPHIGRLFCPERDGGLNMFVLVANANLTFNFVVGTFAILSPIVLLRAQQLKPGEIKKEREGPAKMQN